MITLGFVANFKGVNVSELLFAFLHTNPIEKRYTLGGNFFVNNFVLLDYTPFLEGRQINFDKVVSPKNVSIV